MKVIPCLRAGNLAQSVCPFTPDKMNKQQVTAEIDRIKALIANNDYSEAGKIAALEAQLLTAVDASPAPVTSNLASFDAALNRRSFASPNATGAETAPLRTYVFAQDSLGQPKLIGGTWIGGDIVSDKYAALKDASGNELAVQPDYIGREKSVKFVICDNATGNEYRLSGSSYEAAHKAAGTKMSFAAREMSQTVVEVGGYTRATVVLA